jgi:hypothetical protein
MNKAMGEFLTAQGRVELTMILLLMLIRDEDYEWLFDEMSARTFGKKSSSLKNTPVMTTNLRRKTSSCAIKSTRTWMISCRSETQ